MFSPVKIRSSEESSHEFVLPQISSARASLNCERQATTAPITNMEALTNSSTGYNHDVRRSLVAKLSLQVYFFEAATISVRDLSGGGGSFLGEPVGRLCLQNAGVIPDAWIQSQRLAQGICSKAWSMWF